MTRRGGPFAFSMADRSRLATPPISCRSSPRRPWRVEHWPARRYLAGKTFLRQADFSMFTFLLIVQTLVAATLVAVILMQRSEGGGLGVGGSSAGLMTARGAADFLTRSTSVLGAMFIVLSIVMAAIAGATREPTKIDTSLAGKLTPTQQQQQ